MSAGARRGGAGTFAAVGLPLVALVALGSLGLSFLVQGKFDAQVWSLCGAALHFFFAECRPPHAQLSVSTFWTSFEGHQAELRESCASSVLRSRQQCLLLAGITLRVLPIAGLPSMIMPSP